jgi:hypothetical protein
VTGEAERTRWRKEAAGPEVPVLIDAERLAVRQGRSSDRESDVSGRITERIDYDRWLVEPVSRVDRYYDWIPVEAAAEEIEDVAAGEQADDQDENAGEADVSPA